jgi:hypothetical protein
VLSAAHDAGSWAGGAAGSVLFTWTERTAGLVPISDVSVYAYANTTATGTPVASGVTDELGQVGLYLDPGTYYLFRRKAGYRFTNPATIVVS